MPRNGALRLVVIAFAIVLFKSQASASDAVTTISQSTLTAYALASGIQTGSQTFPVTIWVPEMICTTGEIGGHPIVICRLTFRQVTLWQQSINWAVVNPVFTVNPQGITLSGSMAVTGPNAAAPTVPFSLSANAAYFSSSSLLWLVVSPNAVDVPVTVSAGTYQVGIVVSYNFNIRIPLTPVTFMVSGRNLSASLQNVNIQYGAGNIIISNDFLIQ